MSETTGRFLFLVNPFKGTMSGSDVAAACEAAALAEGIPADVLPVSDGGDGLLDACIAAGLIQRITHHDVPGPLGARVHARVAWLDGTTAVIESSEVIGLRLLDEHDRNPMRTDTGGVGELVVAVLEQGATSVLLGLGGSATMDGGIGMARSWGWYGIDAAGRALGPGGSELSRLVSLRPGWYPACRLTGLVDVTNRLLGNDGARVYARQKGARAAEEEHLVHGLENLVGATAPVGGADVAERLGAGAAGGLGFGLVMFGGGVLKSGAEWMLGRLGVPGRLAAARGLVTAEGAFDETSTTGKLTGRVIELARGAGIPVGLLAPRVSAPPDGVEVETGPGIWDRAMLVERARHLLRRMIRLPLS